MAISDLYLQVTKMGSGEYAPIITNKGTNNTTKNFDCLARILVMKLNRTYPDANSVNQGELRQIILQTGNTILASETSNPTKFMELFGNGVSWVNESSNISFNGKLYNVPLNRYAWDSGCDRTKTVLVDDSARDTSPLIVSTSVEYVIGGFSRKGCIELSNNTFGGLCQADQVIGDECTQVKANAGAYADLPISDPSKQDIINIINKILSYDSPFYYNRVKSTITYSGTLDKNSGILQLNFKTDGEITFGKTPSTNIVHTVYEWLNDVSGAIIPIPNGLKEGDETWYKVWISAYDNNITNPTQPIKSEMLLEFPHTLSTMKLHSIPILSLVNNTDAFKDYINLVNTNTTNFKFKIWMQSFNRHYDIGWIGLTPRQLYEDTLNGTTNSVYYNLNNSIEINATVPLSNSVPTSNINMHVLPEVNEELYIVYRYREALDDDLGEPYNQPSTPTSPSYDSDPPEKVTPTNPHGDVPIGTIIDSMIPQTIEPTINPLLSVDALYTIYKVSLMDIPKIAHFLFNTTWYENLLQINNNPMEHILSFKVSVFDLDSDKNEQIKLVNIPMEYTPLGGTKVIVNGDVIERNAIYTIGQFTITPKYNSFLDITMSDYQLYLPFVGYVDLDPNVILNYQLTLKVYVDALTLLAKYQLTRDDNLIVGEWEFNSSYDLPLSASNKAQAELSMIGSLATSVVSVLSGNPVGFVGGLAGTLMTKYHTSTQGSPSANLSFLTSRQAYIKITRPMWQDIQNFNHTHGRVLNANRRLGDCNGFTKVASGTDFSGLNITGRELDMIKSALQEGIII